MTFSNYWPGSGADSNHPIKAYVADDPNQIFVITGSNVVAGMNTKAEYRTAVFACADFATATSGTTATGLSSASLDLNTIAATKTLNLRILGWAEDPSNADFTAEGIGLLIRLNNHFNSPNGAIVAGTTDTAGI